MMNVVNINKASDGFFVSYIESENSVRSCKPPWVAKFSRISLWQTLLQCPQLMASQISIKYSWSVLKSFLLVTSHRVHSIWREWNYMLLLASSQRFSYYASKAWALLWFHPCAWKDDVMEARWHVTGIQFSTGLEFCEVTFWSRDQITIFLSVLWSNRNFRSFIGTLRSFLQQQLSNDWQIHVDISNRASAFFRKFSTFIR